MRSKPEGVFLINIQSQCSVPVDLDALSSELLLEMGRRVLRIRRFEEAASRLWSQGQIPGGIHLSIGQEGEIVGACMALRTDDYMVGNHRSHGHPIGKGADLRGLMAELMGKVTGVNRGKGGSMHIADFSVGSVGETSIVGSGIPLAVGAALGSQLLDQDRVTLCFFGDGASNEGAFHEGLNLASVWKLPVIFLCENNLFGVTTAIGDVSAVTDIAKRAAAYAMPGIIVDGQDPIAVYRVVYSAVLRARSGGGPSLIEAKTYRYDGHSSGLSGKSNYRTDEEVAAWRKRDPVTVMRDHLLTKAMATEQEWNGIEAKVHQEVATAISFAKDSPYPDPEEAFTNLFAPITKLV
jgi:acetoin:2,6-dichlorophenolindophenol oxidoreductase subunit alpha